MYIHMHIFYIHVYKHLPAQQPSGSLSVPSQRIARARLFLKLALQCCASNNSQKVSSILCSCSKLSKELTFQKF